MYVIYIIKKEKNTCNNNCTVILMFDFEYFDLTGKKKTTDGLPFNLISTCIVLS